MFEVLVTDRFQLSHHSPKQNSSSKDGAPQHMFREFAKFLSGDLAYFKRPIALETGKHCLDMFLQIQRAVYLQT